MNFPMPLHTAFYKFYEKQFNEINIYYHTVDGGAGFRLLFLLALGGGSKTPRRITCWRRGDTDERFAEISQKTGAFPEDLKSLVGKVWDAKKVREFDPSGKVFRHHNVYYLYSRQNSHLFSFWAVPSGERREEGVSWFISASPATIRRWKGPAIAASEIDKLALQPSVQSLALLGLTEQPSTDLRKSSESNRSQKNIQSTPSINQWYFLPFLTVCRFKY